MSKTTAKKPSAAKTIDEIEDSLADLDGTAEAKALRDQVQDEVDKGPQFEAEPEDRAPATTGNLLGRRVKFDGETDGMAGTISQQDPDGKVVIKDDQGNEWNSEIGSFELEPLAETPAAEVAAEPEDRAPEGVPSEEAPKPESKPEKPAKGKKGKPPKADAPAAAAPPPVETKTAAKPPTPNELVYDVRAVKISEIKVPKLYPRKLEKNSEDYLKILDDLRENPQEDAIVLDSWDEKNLVEGLTRLECFKDLGRNVILARVKTGITTAEQRLYQGARLNDRRNTMHWLDYARVFAHLVTTGSMKQGQIAKEFRLNPSEVSRMIAAVQLPKKVLEKAREVDEEGKQKYSQSVVLELTGAPVKARERAVELMEKDLPLAVVDVRELSKTARKEENSATVEKGEEPAARVRGGARPHETRAATYRDLGVKATGEFLRFRVYGDRIEVMLTIPHENKTFRNFELLKAVKETVNDSYANKELTVRNEADLQKELTEARAQISA